MKRMKEKEGRNEGGEGVFRQLQLSKSFKLL